MNKVIAVNPSMKPDLYESNRGGRSGLMVRCDKVGSDNLDGPNFPEAFKGENLEVVAVKEEAAKEETVQGEAIVAEKVEAFETFK
ncbi:MAG: hypothetical protein M0Z61_10085 [Nitrospiraceae bacterium]|nr:hypothetical protein [Nitrospiraceae bacterium]